MCLLDRVLTWNSERIQCSASTHHAVDHPMRAFGRLGAACGIEYAAQAMATHAALQSGGDDRRPSTGLLIGVRRVNLYASRLDDIASDLLIEAECIIESAGHALYQFSIRSNDQLLLEGRAAVVLNANTLDARHAVGDGS